MNGGMIPSSLNKPSTNNASAVKPKIIEITVASLLCLRIDSSSILFASANASAIKLSTSSFVYVLRLVGILFVVLKSSLPNKMVTVYGLVLSIVGMCIFNIGLTYGLGAMGSQTGGVLPAAFMQLPISETSPIFDVKTGLAVVIGFAFILGFGATLAEPALNALGMTVQNLTNGAFKKSMLMYSVAGGVAVGIALGVAKVVLGVDLMKVLLPLYLVGVMLTIFSTEEFVNVAWDSAGVTTGPVTVPLVLAMGLGVGNAVSAVEGFGILSLASICPIVAVLSMGLIIQFMNKRSVNKQSS